MDEITLKQTAEKIRDGHVIIAPLPSGYALICDARNAEPVKRLRKIKNRSAEKGFTILVESDARLNKYVNDVPAIAWDIIDTAENPIVLVLPQGRGVCSDALASDKSIAVRMVAEGHERQLVQAANCPVASTALLNTAGNPVSHPDEAAPEVLSEVDYLISLPAFDLAASAVQPPIVSLGMEGEVKVIREA